MNSNLFTNNDNDYIIEINEFKSNTLVYDPEDFENPVLNTQLESSEFPEPFEPSCENSIQVKV